MNEEPDNRRRERRSILLFLLILFPVSYALQLAIYLLGGTEGTGMKFLAPAAMFLPGLTALLCLKISGEGLGFIDWRPGRLRYWVYGAVIPAATAIACVQVITWLGWGTSPHYHFENGRAVVERGGFLLGRGEQSLAFFAVNVAVTAIVFAVVNGAVAAGEEIGWRGFLQKKLVAETGLWPGIILLGLIWAHWHTPLILMGYNYPETPVLGAFLLWPLYGIFVSMFLAWLTFNGGSVWPAALAHGSLNAFHGHVVDGMRFTVPRLGPDLIALGVAAGLGIGALLLTRVSRNARSTSARDPAPAAP